MIAAADLVWFRCTRRQYEVVADSLAALLLVRVPMARVAVAQVDKVRRPAPAAPRTHYIAFCSSFSYFLNYIYSLHYATVSVTCVSKDQ